MNGVMDVRPSVCVQHILDITNKCHYYHYYVTIIMKVFFFLVCQILTQTQNIKFTIHTEVF